MEIVLEEIGQVLLVRPQFRRLDAAAAIEFRNKVGDHMEGRQLVVMALGNVDFVDSSGLGCLISLFKRLPPGGAMRWPGTICSRSRPMRRCRCSRPMTSWRAGGQWPGALHCMMTIISTWGRWWPRRWSRAAAGWNSSHPMSKSQAGRKTRWNRPRSSAA
ncbi:MAG: STAS domain-containing protein [Sphingomonadales bacterium]|nr:STAS domain-containing protein [Sphingomonadales bacterium]